jgi:ribosomal protein S13
MEFFVDRNSVRLSYEKYLSVEKADGIYFFGKLFDNNITVLRVLLFISGLGLKRLLFIFSAFMGLGFSNRLLIVSGFIFLNVQNLARRLYLGSFVRKLELKNLRVKSRFRTYHSARKTLGLPSRGQRTKTNAGTDKRRRSRVSLGNTVKMGVRK